MNGGHRHLDAQALRASIQSGYKELRAAGYYCRANYWCCQTCALYDIEQKGKRDKFVYYHAQDNSDIDRTASCYLAWAGNGQEIADAMTRHGLNVEWNGSLEQRLHVSVRHDTHDGGAAV